MTETWFTQTRSVTDKLDEFEHKDGIGHFRRDRVTGARGGGVAIFFDKSRIAMSRARIPHSKHEVIAAIGRRTGQRRKCLVIAAYLPPWYNAAQNTSVYKYINDCITLLLNRYDEPYLVLAGDFNRRDIGRAAGNFPLIKTIQTPPTRGSAVLDIMATNMNDLLIDSGVTDPITTEEGAVSYTHLTLPTTPYV